MKTLRLDRITMGVGVDTGEKDLGLQIKRRKRQGAAREVGGNRGMGFWKPPKKKICRRISQVRRC